MVEGSFHVDGFVGSDRVVDAPVGVDFCGQAQAVSDVAAVEMLVFDGSEEAFDCAVGPWRLLPGPDMDDVTFRGHPGSESSRFEA